MSAPGGVESMISEAWATDEAEGAACGGVTPKLAMLRCMSPSTKAVISVPCGIVMSFPFIKEKQRRGGKEYDRCCNHGAGHCADVAAAFIVLGGSQRGFSWSRDAHS